MGGEWWFKFMGDKSTFDLPEYQTFLNNYKEELGKKFEAIDWSKDYRHGSGEAIWFEKTDDIPEPMDNVFCKLFATCTKRCKSEDGVTAAVHVWELLWNPTVESGSFCTNRCRCCPSLFVEFCVELQKEITSKFPNHFQLYLGDGTLGYGPECDLYFGVAPADWKGGYDGPYHSYDSDSHSSSTHSDYDELDFILYGDMPKDYVACGRDCDYCGRCPY